MYDISVVIVNYNVKDAVDNCIASIYKTLGSLKAEIYFVDNNSIDGSAEYISSKYPDVLVIANRKNVGFSKANNIALKRVQGKFILILNPDTVLEEGTFQKLITFCESHANTGAISSKLILSSGKLDYACRRSFPTPSVAIPRILGLSKIFPKSRLFGKYNLTYLDENKTAEVDAICGAFMFIPKTVLDKTGLFDEDYFMYGEDLDLCYRIKQNGYSIYYYPEVTTIHLKGESTRKTNVSFVNNFYGAMSIFVKKNFTGSPRIVLFFLQSGIFYRSFFSYTKRILKIIYPVIIDCLILYSIFTVSVFIRFKMLPNEPYLFIMSVYIAIWIILLTLFGLYTRRHHLSLKRAFNAILFGFFINASITFFLKEVAYSREVVISATVFALLFLPGWRAVINIYRFIISKNITLKKINILVVSDRHLSQNIEEKFESRYNIFYFDRISKDKNIDNLEEIIKLKNIEEVIFSGDHFANQDILRVMWSFRHDNVTFRIIPTGNELILSRIKSGIDSLSLIEIEYNINNKLNIFLKRGFDLILSAILLLLVYPFIFMYSKTAVKKEYKNKSVPKLLLLPEVFTGKYSFVGIPVWYDTGDIDYLGKKGLTGLIQLYNYEGMTEEETDNFILFYAKNQSLISDIEILLKTVFSLIRK